MTGISIPNFVLAPLFILLFAVYLKWLPAGGWNDGAFMNTVLPIVALTAYPVFEIGARFGNARLTFLQKPVSAHDLLLLLRLQIGDEAVQASVC